MAKEAARDVQRQRLLLPPSRARLWLGLVVAVGAPLAVTPLAMSGTVHPFPSALYVLAVVVATLLGRLTSGAVATLESIVLLDYYFIPPLHQLLPSSAQQLIPILVFAFVALVVANLLARQERSSAEANEARRITERERAGLALLSDASELLARSLDSPEMLLRLGRLVVGSIADLCLIDVVDAEGTIERVVAVHRDPGRQHLADLLRERYAPVAVGPHPVARVITTGRPEFAPEMPPSYLQSTTRDEEHLRIVTALGFQSFICVPLLARGQILGTITLVSCDPSRRYGEPDVAIAVEIGRRAAVSVENVRLFRAEQAARRASEEAQERLTMVSNASRVLGTSIDFEETLARVVELATHTLGDYALVYLLEERGSTRLVAAAHRDPALQDVVRRSMERAAPRVDDPTGEIATVLRTGRPLIATPAAADPGDTDADPSALRPQSAMVLPLVILDRTIGVLSVVSTSAERTYDEDDVELAQEIARRMARAIENARLFEERDRIARTLQRALLPPALPSIPGMEIAAFYRAGGQGQDVGGDFYDAFETPDGSWAVVIGDVCGKGPEAAAITGLARHAIRAIAARERRPSQILRSLNDVMLNEASERRFCTVCYARLQPDGDCMLVTTSCGGHPPAVILRVNGEVTVAGAYGALLGVFSDPEVFDTADRLDPGDTLILYTDGLLGRHGAELEPGQGALGEALRSAIGRTARDVADALEQYVAGMPQEEGGDDVAILVLRVAPRTMPFRVEGGGLSVPVPVE